VKRTRDLDHPPLSEGGPATFRPALFEQISRGAINLHQVASSHLRKVGPHAELIRGQEAQTEVAVLFKGWACSYRLLPDGRRQILDVYLPGDLIGLDGFLLARSQKFVVALTDITYGAVDHDTFSRLLGSPDVAQGVISALVAEKLQLNGHLVAVGQMIAEEKIAGLLVEIHERLRHRQSIKGQSFHFPLTQQQIGDFLGMTLVHVNRVLKRLRDSGMVNVKDRIVVIHDMEKLTSLASGGRGQLLRPWFS
jgi:CRP-like cAMP-binding protein